MIKLTVDTNVLIVGIDGTPEERDIFTRLMELRQKGLVDIALTSRFDMDKSADTDIDRVKRHYTIARMLPAIGASFRLGVSRLGQDLLVNKKIYEPLSMLFGVTSPEEANKNTQWDIDHMYGHWAHERDIFLTLEKRILRKKEKLRQLGINVWNPKDFLEAL